MDKIAEYHWRQTNNVNDQAVFYVYITLTLNLMNYLLGLKTHLKNCQYI